MDTQGQQSPQEDTQLTWQQEEETEADRRPLLRWTESSRLAVGEGKGTRLEAARGDRQVADRKTESGRERMRHSTSTE